MRTQDRRRMCVYGSCMRMFMLVCMHECMYVCCYVYMYARYMSVRMLYVVRSWLGRVWVCYAVWISIVRLFVVEMIYVSIHARANLETYMQTLPVDMKVTGKTGSAKATANISTKMVKGLAVNTTVNGAQSKMRTAKLLVSSKERYCSYFSCVTASYFSWVTASYFSCVTASYFSCVRKTKRQSSKERYCLLFFVCIFERVDTSPCVWMCQWFSMRWPPLLPELAIPGIGLEFFRFLFRIRIWGFLLRLKYACIWDIFSLSLPSCLFLFFWKWISRRTIIYYVYIFMVYIFMVYIFMALWALFAFWTKMQFFAFSLSTPPHPSPILGRHI